MQLKYVNNILKVVLFLGVIAATGYAVTKPLPDYNLNLKEPAHHASKAMAHADGDYAGFTAQLEARRVFTPAIKPQEASTVNAGPGAKPLAKVVENLRLAGIMTAGGAKAIIEDKAKGASVYVKEGDNFADNIHVDKINPDSVVLSRDGEQCELRL